MNSSDLIQNKERARRYLAKAGPAIAGEHGHTHTFKLTAALLRKFHLGERDALELLTDWNRTCRPPWREHELVHKVRSASGSSSSPSISRRPKAVFQPEYLRAIASKLDQVDDIAAFITERSAVLCSTQDSASVLRQLYRRGSGERLLVFSDMKSQGELVWDVDHSEGIRNEQIPSGPDGVWFLPQPVNGVFDYVERLGKPSRRCEERITTFRYMVLESDEADAQDWLRALAQLPLPIESICESGGRSIHALVRLDAASKSDWTTAVGSIEPALVRLGADPGALTAIRLTRLPCAMRGPRQQRLLFLRPGATATPIVDLPMQGGTHGH